MLGRRAISIALRYARFMYNAIAIVYVAWVCTIIMDITIRCAATSYNIHTDVSSDVFCCLLGGCFGMLSGCFQGYVLDVLGDIFRMFFNCLQDAFGMFSG